MKKYDYKVVRYELKMKYHTESANHDGAQILEDRLKELGSQGYRVVERAEEYEGLTSRKAIIMEKVLDD